VIEATAAAPDAPAKASRIRGIVLFVVASQLAIIALGMVFFTALGLANENVGGCGGG
jgi:hypothetical protein